MAAAKGNTYAKNNKGGRPTAYNKKYCDAIIKYFNVPPNKLVTVATSKGYGRAGNQNFEKTEVKLMPNSLPTLQKFAMSIGVTKKTLLNWTTIHIEFLHAYEEAKELYKDFLNENGLMNLYSSQYAKFVAINTTDMKDKTDNTFRFDFNKGDQKEYE